MSARKGTIDIYDPDAVAKLIRRAHRNPQRYHDEIFNAFWSDAYRLAYSILGNAQDAEEVAQTALTRALDKLDTLNNPKVMLKWVRRIVGNIALNYCRDEGRRMAGFHHEDSDISEIETLPEMHTNYSHHLPDELVMREEVNRMVFGLVQDLPSKQRLAIMSYYYAELSAKEIAQNLEITENAVNALLFRARETLNARIQEAERTKQIRMFSTTALPLGQVIQDAATLEVAIPASPIAGAGETIPASEGMRVPIEKIKINATQWVTLGVTSVILLALGGYALANRTPDGDAAISQIASTEVADIQDTIKAPEKPEPKDNDEPSTDDDSTLTDPSETGSDDPSPVAPTPHYEIPGNNQNESQEIIIDFIDRPAPPAPTPPIEYPSLPSVGSFLRFGMSDNNSITWRVEVRTQTTITITPIDDLPSTEGIFTSAEQTVILSTTGGIRPTIQLDGYRLNFVFKGGFCYAEPN